MEWQDQGVSSDIEDRRGSSGGGFGFGGGMGIGGFILLLIISVITGRNFFAGSGGDANLQPAPSNNPVTGSPAEERDVHLISFVLDDAQNTWEQIFEPHGRQYRRAKLVLYRDVTYSGLRDGAGGHGSVLCAAGRGEVSYIDLSFWQELKRFGGDTGDFAQAYVVAHELGHHVQKLLGIEQRMRTLSQQDEGEQNPLSVDLELQADCFAGVWGHSTQTAQHCA